MHLELKPEELELLAWQVSNEVVNGFKVDQFSERIGVSKEDFKSMANRLRSAAKTVPILLNTHEGQIFRNALALVIDELGIEEFHTRTGHEYEDGCLLLQKLSQ